MVEPLLPALSERKEALLRCAVVGLLGPICTAAATMESVGLDWEAAARVQQLALQLCRRFAFDLDASVRAAYQSMF